MTHSEEHRSHRVGWLRAAVLGANDGIISTASLIIGVTAANATQENILIAGVAGLVAGAMSMAAGEYVSVSSQLDTENADLEIERKSLAEDYESEKDELALIYQKRGLEAILARQVAEQLMSHDALGAHSRDDIGITETGKPQPLQAACYSAGAFAIGASLPLFVTWIIPFNFIITTVTLLSLMFLSFLGGLAAFTGGASIIIGAFRVTFLGAIAMGLTAVIGHLFGSVV